MSICGQTLGRSDGNIHYGGEGSPKWRLKQTRHPLQTIIFLCCKFLEDLRAGYVLSYEFPLK